MKGMKMSDDEYYTWVAKILKIRPKGNCFLDCDRGFEVGRLCMDIQREQFSWRRSDDDTFWVDVQLFVKYGLTDEEIRFVCNLEPGLEVYKSNADERKAYAELKRGLDKLRYINVTDTEAYEQICKESVDKNWRG